MSFLLALILLNQSAVLDVLKSTYEQLPSFVCHEKQVKFRNHKVVDVRDADFRLSGSGEAAYSNIFWKGKLRTSIKNIPYTADSNYGSFLSNLIDKLAKPNQAYVTMTPDGDWELRFFVKKEESTWQMFGDWGECTMAFSAVILISPDHGVVKIYETSEYPMRHLRKSEAFMKINRQLVGGEEFMLPSTVWQQGTLWNDSFQRWESTFDAYRRFSVDSKVLAISAK